MFFLHLRNLSHIFMSTYNRIRASLIQNKYPLLLLAIYSLFAVFFCSKMSPLYPLNEWSDVNLYFNIGKAIANGRILYLDVFDHKGPLIFFLYALGYTISNDSFFGMFIIEWIAWMVLSYTAYYTAKLFLDRAYSFLVAIAFIPLFILNIEQGGSAEEFMVVCIAISLYFFIRYFINPEVQNWRYMLVHGVMWGIVLLTKFTLTAFWIPLLIAVALIQLRRKEYKNLLMNIGTFLIGGIIVFLPVLLYFIVTGSLSSAVDSYIVVNLLQDPLAEGSYSLNILQNFYLLLRLETIQFIIVLIGAIGFPLIFIRNRVAQLSLIVCFFVLYAVSVMVVYRQYYSISYSIYGILALIVFAHYFQRYIKINLVWHLAVSFAFIALIISISIKDFFGIPPRTLARKVQPSGVMYQFAEKIQQENNPTLLNLYLDEANSIFTLTNVVPNIRYFITPNLSYEQYPKMRDEQEKYIINKEVMFIVLSTKADNYEHFKSFKPLQENYEVVDVYDGDRTDFYLYKLK